MKYLITLILVLNFLPGYSKTSDEWESSYCQASVKTYCNSSCSDDTLVKDATMSDLASCVLCLTSEHKVCMKLGSQKYKEKNIF